MRTREGTLKKCAELILAGRYGRACRLWARFFHTSPRLLKDKQARERWARSQR